MTGASDQELFYFPPPPSDDAIEWPGEPIGKSNTITRTKSRTRYHDKTVDAKPGRREELVNAAVEYIVTRAATEPIHMHDVVIHGVKVRAITNSRHLIDFWRENWFSAAEWKEATGIEPPAHPRVIVYALGGVESQREAACYSHDTSTVIFFNTSYYGQLKSWVLGAVGRVLASEFGIHSIHGACVEKGGKGILYIAPTGTGKSTSSYGLMTYPDTRFHSDDWVYVRYVLWTKDGQPFAPTLVETPTGQGLRGYRCLPWLEAHRGESVRIEGLGLRNEEIETTSDQIDWAQSVGAYAYTSEKIFYLRSNLVENFPESAYEILHTDLENVPSIYPAFAEAHRPVVEGLVSLLLGSSDPRIRAYFRGLPRDEVATLLGRLFAFDNARAMLDITRVLPRERVFWNPLEPVRLGCVFLLKRDRQDPVVMEALGLDKFMDRLLIGLTPDGKREIAYNAYRTVDDEAERQCVASLEGEAGATGRPLYELFLRRADVPGSLREEFSLFSVLHQSAACYDCNTILQQDPDVRSRKEAVGLTIDLIAKVATTTPRDLRLTLSDYRRFLMAR